MKLIGCETFVGLSFQKMDADHVIGRYSAKGKIVTKRKKWSREMSGTIISMALYRQYLVVAEYNFIYHIDRDTGALLHTKTFGWLSSYCLFSCRDQLFMGGRQLHRQTSLESWEIINPVEVVCMDGNDNYLVIHGEDSVIRYEHGDYKTIVWKIPTGRINILKCSPCGTWIVVLDFFSVATWIHALSGSVCCQMSLACKIHDLWMDRWFCYMLTDRPQLARTNIMRNTTLTSLWYGTSPSVPFHKCILFKLFLLPHPESANNGHDVVVC